MSELQLYLSYYLIVSCTAPAMIIELEDQTVVEGGNAIFNCTAPSEPSVHTLTWEFMGTVISNDSKHVITSVGADTSLLTIFNVTTSDAGEYTCFVANQHANDSATAELDVLSEY